MSVVTDEHTKGQYMKKSSENENVDLDDFDLEEFDFGDPMGDADAMSDDRKPVTQFKDGLLEGIKTTSQDPSLYINTMRSVLPEGYGNAFDTVTDVKDKGLGLYNEVVQELRPGIRDLKLIGRRAKSAVNSMLPDKVSEQLDEFLRDKDETRSGTKSLSKSDTENANIASELGELFKIQAGEKQEERAEGLVKDAVQNKRFATNTGQLDGISKGISSLVSYQNQITSKYQQKSLEYAMRSFYALRDISEISKASATDFTNLLNAIKKNTGLPESEKIQLSETASQMTRERLIGAAQDKMAPTLRKAAGAFAKTIGTRAKAVSSDFMDVLSQVAMGAEQTEGMSELGISTAEMGGELAGDSGLRALAERAGKYLRPHVAKNKKLVSKGNDLEFMAKNGHKMLRDGIREKEFTNPIMQLIQEATISAMSIRRESKIGWDSMENSMQSVPFDSGTRKSIVEIIPLWLSKIYQVGREALGYKEGLETYDGKTNSIISVKELGSRIRNEAFDPDAMESSRNRTKDLSKSVMGEVTNESISGKLEMLFMKQARGNDLFDPAKLASPTYLTSAGFSEAEAATVSKMVKARFKLDDDLKMVGADPNATKLRNEMSDEIDRLRDDAPKPYELLNMYANTGQYEAVRSSGLTTNVGNELHVSEDAYYDAFRNNVEGKSPSVVTPNSRTPGPTGTLTSQPSGPEAADLSALHEEVSGILTLLKANFSGSVGGSPMEGFQTLNDTLESQSLKVEAQTANETLMEILETLRAGIPTRNIFPDMEGMGDRMAESVKTQATGIWGKTKDLGGDLWSAGRTGVGTVWSGAKWANNKLGAPLRMAKRGLGAGWDLGKKAVGSANKFRAMNVYLPGSETPVLTRKGFMAGDYFDAETGKVLSNLGDIKGAVNDIDGVEILSLEEFEGGLVDSKGKKVELARGFLRSGLNAGKSDAFKVAGWAKNRVLGMAGMPGRVLGMGMSMVSKALNYVGDVYVAGESSPRLLRKVMSLGGYYHANGEVLKHYNDIRSDIKDEAGNVVLQLSELGSTVDSSGKPIRSIAKKAMGLLGKGLGLITKSAKWATGKAKSMVGKALTVGKDLTMGAVRGTGRFIKGGIGHMVGVGGMGGSKTLDRIHELLVRYFASKGLKMPVDGIKSPGVPGTDAKAADVRAGLTSLLGKAMGMSDDEVAEKVEAAKGGWRKKRKTLGEKVKDKKAAMLDRSGSWVNQMRDRAKKVKGGKSIGKRIEEKGSGSGALGTIIGLIGTAVTVLTGMFTLGKSIFSGITGLAKWIRGLALAKGAADMADGIGDIDTDRDGKKKRKGKGPKGKAGWGKRLWSGVKSVGRVAGTVARGAGAVARGVGWVARGAMVVTSGILSAPVLIGAAVVGALAIGSYYTYKYFANKLTMMQKLRMSQYGLSIDSNKDQCVQVAELESILESQVVIAKDGQGAITGSVDWAAILKVFGIDVKDQQRLANFRDWFVRRFKPVFINHVALMHTLGDKAKLVEADTKVPDNKKWKYAASSLLKDDGVSPVYQVSTSPFADTESVTGTEVIDEVIADFKDEYGDLDGKPTTVTRTSNGRNPKAVTSAADRRVSGIEAKGDTSVSDRRASRIEALEAKGDLSPGDKKLLAALKRAQEMSKPKGDITTPSVDKGDATTSTTAPGSDIDRLADKIDALQSKANPTSMDRKLLKLYTKQLDSKADMLAAVSQAEQDGTVAIGAKRVNYTKEDGKFVTRPSAAARNIDERGRVSKPPTISEDRGIENVDSLPRVIATGSRDKVAPLLDAVAQKVGVDSTMLSRLVMEASGYDSAKKDRSRRGMFQMDAATWRRMLLNHGAKYGLDRNHSITDVRAEALMAAEYLKSNLAEMDPQDMTDSNIKLAHYAGNSVANLLKALPEEGLVSDVLSPFDIRRFNVTKDTTKAQFLANLGGVKNQVADMYVRNSAKGVSAPVSAEVIQIRKAVEDNRQGQAPDIKRQQELRKQHQEAAQVRRGILDSNVNKKASQAITGDVVDILGQQLAVQTDSMDILRAVEQHMRNLSKQLLEAGGKEADLEQVAPPAATPPPKSRVNSKRNVV